MLPDVAAAVIVETGYSISLRAKKKPPVKTGGPGVG